MLIIPLGLCWKIVLSFSWPRYASIFLQRGPRRIGSVYKKAIYKQYTDASYSQEIPKPTWLGYLGPILRAEVHDVIIVHLKNFASRRSPCILTVSSMRRTQKVKPISLSFTSYIFKIFYYLCWLPSVSTRRTVSRRNLRHSEEGWRGSTGWKVHLHLDCEARLCSSKGWCQLPDLGLPLPRQRFTRHFLWAYWSPSHL